MKWGGLTMKFHKKVVISKELASKKEKVLEAIKSKELSFCIHVICISPGKHQLEMFPIGLNIQPNFDVENHVIVGIAGTYSQGMNLFEKLSQLVFDTRGDLDFKKFYAIDIENHRN